MKCNEVQELLADALGDELTPAGRQALDAHLQECGRCRRELDSALTALAKMRSLPGPESVSVDRVGDRLVISGTRAPLRIRAFRPSGPAFRYAASVLIAFASGYAFHAGRMMMSQAWSAKPPRQTSLQPRDTDEPQETLESALARVHVAKPGRSHFAKCVIAMFQ